MMNIDTRNKKIYEDYTQYECRPDDNQDQFYPWYGSNISIIVQI